MIVQVLRIGSVIHVWKIKFKKKLKIAEQIKYIFKGDDDTLVNPYELQKLIESDIQKQSKLEKVQNRPGNSPNPD